MALNEPNKMAVYESLLARILTRVYWNQFLRGTTIKC